MKKPYTKSEIQINFERHIYLIKAQNSNSLASLRKTEPSLYKSFMLALYNQIASLLQERRLHTLIESIMYYPNMHNYDCLDEVISETFLSLFKTIRRKDSQNYGRVRIDVFLDAPTPEIFVKKLRCHILNNILLDTLRRYKTYSNHTESTTIINDDHEINKLDFLAYNKNNIDSIVAFEDSVISRLAYTDDPTLCKDIIIAVIERFRKRKPVALFIYNMIMLNMYDAKKVIRTLTYSTPSAFNNILHAQLLALESEYNVDLSSYDSVEFNADKYLASLRSSIDDPKALRDRIDRLVSNTRKIVYNLEVCKQASKKYVYFNKTRKTYHL